MLDPDHPLTDLLRRDRRYHLDAYLFVFEALRHAQEELGMGNEFPPQEDDEPAERHVTGQELCEAMRLYAHDQFGYMAKAVLNHWGIRCTGDFGELVFNLIEIEQMRKTPQDRREDFDDVFDFQEGFEQGFQFTLPDSTKQRKS
jgi:uncharacterized repeat protein (TIGR04138 family)